MEYKASSYSELRKLRYHLETTIKYLEGEWGDDYSDGENQGWSDAIRSLEKLSEKVDAEINIREQGRNR